MCWEENVQYIQQIADTRVWTPHTIKFEYILSLNNLSSPCCHIKNV